MAADDRTSQDAAVIGDDLVEALGFEPITSDVTEVALLDDLEGEDHDDAVATVVDDIEILDDAASVDDSVASDETAEPAGDDDLGVDDLLASDETAEPAGDDDLGVDDLLASDETAEPAGDIDVQEIDAVDVDAAEAAEPTTDEDSDAEPEPDELPLDEGAADDADESSVDPVVFFNNGVDTDTAPLADVGDASSDLAETPAADTGEVEADERAAVDGGADAVEVDEASQAEPDDESLVAGLIDLDDERIEPEPHSGTAIDLTEPASTDTDLADRDAADPDTDLTDADAADPDTDADAIVDDATAVDQPIESEAVALLEAPVAVPGPPSHDDQIQLPPLVVGPPADATRDGAAIVAPESTSKILADPRRPKTRKKLRARKSRRVIRHVDPWSVLTFSVLFHLCFFAALLLASVLVWNAALAAGTIENIESFIRELGDYETFEINSDQVFRAAALIAGLLTLASSVMVVLLTVVFNLISDLIGGIRVTVIEEETVRVPTTAKK